VAEASAVSRRDFGPYYTFDHVQNACQRCGGTEGFLVCHFLVIFLLLWTVSIRCSKNISNGLSSIFFVLMASTIIA
jgi:hypothetical protein|tara:strand:- start:2995 stop:3222 length:228 start_codon:yes stop_codon:yes gene_type:complete